jgi:Tfp pilus assembly PilM family ATPase
VLGIDGSRVVVHRDSFPQLAKKDLLQSILFELKREMGKENEDTGEIVYNYKTIGNDPKTPGNTEYLTMGMPADEIEGRIQYFIHERVVPHKVVPNIVGMKNFLELIPKKERAGTIGILDIGAQRSMLVIFRNGQLDFFREIVVGGEDFTKAITGTIFHEGRAIQFTEDEALEFKVKYGYPLGFSEGMTYRGAPLTEVGAMMRPVLERLAGEIHRSIGFYGDKTAGDKVQNIYLIGGGSRMKHLSQVLMEKIEIPVASLPYFKNIRVVGSKEQQNTFQKRYLEQAASLAMAMETNTEGSLLPLPYKRIHTFNSLNKTFQFVAGIIFIIILSVYWNASHELGSLKKRLGMMEARALKSKNSGKMYATLQTQKNILENKINNMEGKIQQDEYLIPVLRLVSHSIPEKLALLSFTYEQEKVDQKNEPVSRKKGKKEVEETPQQPKWVVEMKGMSDVKTPDVKIYLAQFILKLESSAYFDDIKLVNEVDASEENPYEFELVGYLNR